MIVVVMGVSGSGKTSVGAEIATLKGWPFVDGDSLHPPSNVEKMTHGRPLTDADRAPWLDAIGEVMDIWEHDGVDGVVACSALKKSYRDRIRGDRRDVWFAFLDIDTSVLEARLANRRGHFMPSMLLPSQLNTLEKPTSDEHAITVRVHRETPLHTTATRAITALDKAVAADR